MSHGGARAGAGRKAGVPNKATAAREAEIRASGLTPLEYMLNVLRDETADASRRDWAAEKAAPYVHPKLAAIEHTGKDGGPIETASDTRSLARAVLALFREANLDSPP